LRSSGRCAFVYSPQTRTAPRKSARRYGGGASAPLITFNALTHTYDANGNLTSDGTRTYTYDAADRLKTVTQGGTTTTFAYDGLGRRLKQTVGTTETRYLWCGAAICQQRDATDVVQKRFVAEGEYVLTGTKKYLYLTDHLGSVRDLVDITGTPTLVGSFDYTPYGAVARSWGTVTPGYTYAGLFAHPQTGLLLSATRAYDPAKGKWLNRDGIREAGGINLTGYVGASPAMANDPLGLTPIDDFAEGVGIGIIGGVVAIGVVSLLPAAVVASPFFLVPAALIGGAGFGAWAGALAKAIAGGCTGDIARLLGEGFGGGLVGGFVGRLPKITIDTFIKNPRLLFGKSPGEVWAMLDGLGANWAIRPSNQGSHAGQGIKFVQITPGGEMTGVQVIWHPGGGHHGSPPYWKINNGIDPPIRVGPQFPKLQ
jgi:RHS repeat-associated protein